MRCSFINRTYTPTIIAQTGKEFSNFAPYVASINDAGTVAFQATLSSGGTGIYCGRGKDLTPLIEPGGEFSSIDSHPDINNGMDMCFYARDQSGSPGVYLLHGWKVEKLAANFGPLGPTINATGMVAFRAKSEAGVEGIYRGSHDGVQQIVAIGEKYKMFYGLPVVNARGHIVFRCDRTSGMQTIAVDDGEDRTRIAGTGYVYDTLGLFPMMNDAGTVAFCTTLRNGSAAIFEAAGGVVETLVNTSAGFESFRGVLMNNAGQTVFYATPVGGTLGVYSGADPVKNRVLGIGDALFDTTIQEFALNPVSINERGELAVRVKLADARQFILRLDPA